MCYVAKLQCLESSFVEYDHILLKACYLSSKSRMIFGASVLSAGILYMNSQRSNSLDNTLACRRERNDNAADSREAHLI